MAASSKSKNDQELVELQRELLSSPTVGIPNTADPEVRRTFMDRRAAQREAYGQFVADEDIFDPEGVSRVFTIGMQVPLEHVEKWDLEALGKVRRVATAEEARRGFTPPSIGPGTLIPEREAATPAVTEKK